jgi:hypothetical protein
LRNVQAGGRVCEASSLDDFKKRSGRTDIHVLRVCSLDDRYGREVRGSFEVVRRSTKLGLELSSMGEDLGAVLATQSAAESE